MSFEIPCLSEGFWTACEGTNQIAFNVGLDTWLTSVNITKEGEGWGWLRSENSLQVLIWPSPFELFALALDFLVFEGEEDGLLPLYKLILTI